MKGWQADWIDRRNQVAPSMPRIKRVAIERMGSEGFWARGGRGRESLHSAIPKGGNAAMSDSTLRATAPSQLRRNHCAVVEARPASRRCILATTYSRIRTAGRIRRMLSCKNAAKNRTRSGVRFPDVVVSDASVLTFATVPEAR